VCHIPAAEATFENVVVCHGLFDSLPNAVDWLRLKRGKKVKQVTKTIEEFSAFK
jgi:hypothetical protein